MAASSQARPDSDRTPVVETVGLSKIFRDFWGRPKAAAVNNLDLRIDYGQVLGLLGPNGSGKSTTVKMVLGLLYPSAGSLKVFGQSPAHVQTKSRIGYLPEETYLYKYLTAAETLDFFGSLFQLPANERHRRTQMLLEMVGLTHAANRPVGEFSKGMARRIGLAQALINDPDLVILDEPTSGLDPIGCQMVKTVIRHLSERRKTVILCSHLLADVQDVCDRALIMYGGRIRAEGNLRDLLTVSGKSRITLPALSTEEQELLMHAIAQTLGRSEDVAVDHPTVTLEEFFIDVVRRARADASSVATAGAREEGKIADFLSTPVTGADVLDKFVVSEPEPEPEEPAEPVAPPPDLAKLEDLAEEEPEPEATPATKPEPEMTEAERAEKNRQIEALLKNRSLGGDDDDE